MASLQTQILVDNEWVTRTITAEELIGASNSHAKDAATASPTSPKHGILTRTIIQSPVIRWVIPVQLRSSRFNDVALIGVCYSLHPPADLISAIFPAPIVVNSAHKCAAAWHSIVCPCSDGMSCIFYLNLIKFGVSCWSPVFLGWSIANIG